MSKKLSEMTLDELWKLFPIFLVPHKDEWKDWFNEEEKIIKNLLVDLRILKIEHIGSTVVPSIHAKDIVDILIVINESDFMNAVDILKKSYICMYQKDTRATFNKGYTEMGFAERVFHLHLHIANDIDELYFRDYLLHNPDVARQYEVLKLNLWKTYEHNRDGYTKAKTEFVKDITQKAKVLYKERY